MGQDAYMKHDIDTFFLNTANGICNDMSSEKQIG